VRRLFSLNTQFRSKRKTIFKESIMVLNRAMEFTTSLKEELTLMPVEAVYESDTNPLPVFLFGDDDDLEEDDDFDDEEDDFGDEEEDDDYEDDELDDDDDDYDEDEEDDDYEEDDEAWEDDDE